MRWFVGILIGIFLLPIFLGAGVIGGCFMALASEGSSAGNSDAIFFIPVAICGIAGIAVTVLIARAIPMGQRRY